MSNSRKLYKFSRENSKFSFYLILRIFYLLVNFLKNKNFFFKFCFNIQHFYMSNKNLYFCILVD